MNRKIVEYIVVEAKDISSLTMNVNDKIKIGFQPYKSMSLPGTYTNKFHQTMVKYEN